MINWNETMSQTFEYFRVDPNTWRDIEPINSITESRIERDLSVETLGSASITSTDALGECYIRIYMAVSQNGFNRKIALGTFMVQTPSYSFDGKNKKVAIDAYTPLIELKEKLPDLGYFIQKDSNILSKTHMILRDKLRAPIIPGNSEDTIPYEFVSNTTDTWLSYIIDFVKASKHNLFLDELGRLMFSPSIKLEAMSPIWTYTDDNSSILYPSITVDNDLYGIPNVVEVIYSNSDTHLYYKVENNEEHSPVSIINRGREITHRVDNPEISGTPSLEKIKRYAEDLLEELSSLEYTITYTHGYCPVQIGDCVILNYEKAGLYNVKAKVISQSISCIPGSPVEEKSIFKNNLWR